MRRRSQKKKRVLVRARACPCTRTALTPSRQGCTGLPPTLFRHEGGSPCGTRSSFAHAPPPPGHRIAPPPIGALPNTGGARAARPGLTLSLLAGARTAVPGQRPPLPDPTDQGGRGRGARVPTPKTRAAPRPLSLPPAFTLSSHLIRDQVLDAVLLARLLQGGLGACLVVRHDAWEREERACAGAGGSPAKKESACV